MGFTVRSVSMGAGLICRPNACWMLLLWLFLILYATKQDVTDRIRWAKEQLTG